MIFKLKEYDIECNVPDAAPRYNNLHPGVIGTCSSPDRIPAANFDLNGFHTLYSIFSFFPSLFTYIHPSLCYI